MNQSKPSPRSSFPAGTESPFGCHVRNAQNPSGIFLFPNLGFSSLPASPCLEQEGRLHLLLNINMEKRGFLQEISPFFNLFLVFLLFFLGFYLKSVGFEPKITDNFSMEAEWRWKSAFFPCALILSAADGFSKEAFSRRGNWESLFGFFYLFIYFPPKLLCPNLSF